MALRIAETGHLTFCTLHTNSAYSNDQPYHRRVSRQQQSQSAHSSHSCSKDHLQALLPKHPATAAAWRSDPRAELRYPQPDPEDKSIDLLVMQTVRTSSVCRLHQALASLYHKKQITLDVALQRSSNVDELKELIDRGSGLNDSYGGNGRPATRPAAGGSPYAQARPIGERPRT